MKTLVDSRSRPTSILFGILILTIVVAIAPHAFAQLSYTPADDPHGPLQPAGWITGLAVAGVLSGVGVFTAVQYGKRH
jgi:hypothetical protein